MAKYTIEKIRQLPDALQDRYFDPAVDERYITEIYPHLNEDGIARLKDLVLDVYFKALTPSGFVSALREIITDETAYKEVLIKVLGLDFLPIADELGADVLDLIQKNGGDPLLFRTKVPVSDVMAEIKKKFPSDIPKDERMAHRFDNILKSKVTNARTDAQVMEMLTGNPKTSGIGLGKEKAAAILLIANEEVKKLETRNVTVISDEEYGREGGEREGGKAGEPEGEGVPAAIELVEQAISEEEEGEIEAPMIEPATPQPEEKEERRDFDAFGADDKREIEEIVGGLGPSKTTIAQKAVAITLETLADEALGASGVPLDDDMRKRFRYAVDLFHRDLRDELETRSKLTMAVASGGMGLNEEQADKVMALLKTRIGEYRAFMTSKTAAEKQNYVSERTAAEATRGVEEERRRKTHLDRRFRQLTGKEAPLPEAGAVAGAPPATVSEPTRVTVVAEEEHVIVPKAVVHDMLQRAGEPESPEVGKQKGTGNVTKVVEPPPGLPVVEEPPEALSDMEAFRKEMAEPSDEQMLATAAVGAVSEGVYLAERESEKAGKDEAAPQAKTAPATVPSQPMPKATTLPPAPKTVQPPPIAPTRPASMQAPSPQAAAMPSFRPSMPSQSGKPLVSDIKYTPKLTGPVDELRSTTLADFRRLSKDPKEATLKIKDKLDLLAQRSHELKLEGVKAWQESPANKAYLDVLRASLEGRPVADVLREREADKNALKRNEFEAIMELNRTIRFG